MRTARRPEGLEGTMQGSSFVLPEVMEREGVIQTDLIQSSWISGAPTSSLEPFFLWLVARLHISRQLLGDRSWYVMGHPCSFSSYSDCPGSDHIPLFQVLSGLPFLLPQHRPEPPYLFPQGGCTVSSSSQASQVSPHLGTLSG